MKFFEIDFLEAGERGSGDAIALRYRTNDDLDYIHVVDGGYADDGEKLVGHIRQWYDDPVLIDHVVLTHPDGDHASGLKRVLEEFDVTTLWMNRPWAHIDELLPRFKYQYTEQGLIQRLRRDFPFTKELEDIAVANNIAICDAFQGDRIGEFTVLAPTRDRYLDLIVQSEKTPEQARQAAIAGSLYERAVGQFKKFLAAWGEENLKGDNEGTSSENESSIVQYAELCGRRILLTGDTGVNGLREAYEYAIQLGVDLPGLNLFDVPHHGSRRNISSETLNLWLGEKLPQQPERGTFTAMISANQNDPNHPKLATRRALVHRGANVIQTKGTIRHQGGDAPDRGWSPSAPLPYPEEMEDE